MINIIIINKNTNKVKHTICSFVRSKSLGPNIAGAKNLKNINPDTTEYLISLFSEKKKNYHYFKLITKI